MRFLLPLMAAAALAAQPHYTAESVVNSATHQHAKLGAPGLLTVYGVNLVRPGFGTKVLVGGVEAQLLFAAPGQVNFVIPYLRDGATSIRVLSGSLTGPAVQIPVMTVCPELYAFEGGFVAATHADGRPLTEADPARPGQVVTIYGTGFGPTRQDRGLLSISELEAISLVTPLEIWIDGQRLPKESILFQGVTPPARGLNQINLRLPEQVTADPYIQLGQNGEPTSRTGIRLLVRPAESE